MVAIRRLLLAVSLVAAAVSLAHATGPLPINNANISVSWETGAGTETVAGVADYSGTSPADASELEPGSNIRYVGGANVLAKRVIAGAFGPDESVLYHGFFKPFPFTTDWFDGIAPDGNVTFEVQNIQFAEPVVLQTDTFLWHKRWDADQADQLSPGYIHVDNLDTGPAPFRDLAEFQNTVPPIFASNPDNFTVGTLSGANALEVFGQGTNTVGWRITVPYALFEHLENAGQTTPGDLPAPHGFLEPFHFHFEMAVARVPEPATGLMLLAGGLITIRRRTRRA